MFGDVLDESEATKLIAALSNCRHPLECAHGRPTIAPLVRLGE